MFRRQGRLNDVGPEQDWLVDGELALGQFQVAVARKRGAEWRTLIPPLNALATNYRLMLWPQTLKPYPPASIPCTYLLEARDVELQEFRGLLLRLTTGHRIYLVVAAEQGRTLRDHIRRMVRPPRDNPLFASGIDAAQIARLIQFLEGR